MSYAKPFMGTMHLHIICSYIPYPTTFGKAIDTFYRIKTLAELGLRIHLHCFEQDQAHAAILRSYCEEIKYYPAQSIPSLSLSLPRAVQSFRSDRLLERLLQDSHPILFEGLESCYYLDNPYLEFRQKLVRLPRIEYKYYEQWAEKESSWFQARRLKSEAKRFREFERVLLKADYLLTISAETDTYYDKGHTETIPMPPFHGYEYVESLSGIGDYCLFHGNLDSWENHDFARFLIEKVFSQLDYPLIIAGQHPQPDLITSVSQFSHIKLRHNLSPEMMKRVIREAQIHILPGSMTSGTNMKLINALFAGRFCITDPSVSKMTSLNDICLIAHNIEELKQLIRGTFKLSFNPKEKDRRQQILDKIYSDRFNAKRLLDLLEY